MAAGKAKQIYKIAHFISCHKIYRHNLMDLSGSGNFGGFCGIIKSDQCGICGIYGLPEIIIYKSC